MRVHGPAALETMRVWFSFSRCLAVPESLAEEIQEGGRPRSRLVHRHHDHRPVGRGHLRQQLGQDGELVSSSWFQFSSVQFNPNYQVVRQTSKRRPTETWPRRISA